MSQADRIFSRQHRTALYQLLVSGPEFRVLRRDRSGVIVSEAHSYVDTHSETEDLLRILYRCSQFTPEQCGMDPTAIRLRKGSCGWGQMKAAGVPFSSDLDESVRRIALVEVPPNFQHPEANPLPSPLLVEGHPS